MEAFVGRSNQEVHAAAVDANKSEAEAILTCHLMFLLAILQVLCLAADTTSAPSAKSAVQQVHGQPPAEVLQTTGPCERAAEALQS